MKHVFTSEQVSFGHPDKICDQISDAILDECLKQDPYSRVACEAFAKNYDIVVGGEISTKANIDIEYTINNLLKNVIKLKDWDKYIITNLLDRQSPEIAQGVDIGGAGDQGLMFGYATDETQDYMPLAWVLATDALINLKNLNDPNLLQDAKSQVTIDYTNTIPKIDTFVLSTQHVEEISEAKVKEIVYSVMDKTAKDYNLNTDFKKFVNPTGRFVIGGTIGDAGLTGRKIIADTYGSYARHGGGAFSGKDATKVDRSAAYIARYIAKNIVAASLCKKCEIQISYAIGVAEPVSVMIDTFGSEKVDKDKILECILENVDLTPKGIIEKLDLRKPIFSQTSTYGHFGKKNKNLNWEKLDLVDIFKKQLL